MFIKQVLNNNVVIALDSANNEMIIDAKGIGFAEKANTIVDESKYPNMRKFILDNRGYQEVKRIYDSIPTDIINLSMSLLEKGYKEKDIKHLVSMNAVLLLTDHLNETIKRLEKGIYLRNALTNEIKTFYLTEFNIASEAKEALMEKSIYLNDDEIAFIAIHIINITSDNIMETTNSIQIVDDIVNIIRRMLNVELKINTYNYARFITHLKYFSIRILNKENIKSDYDPKLEAFIKENYREAYACSLVIRKYIKGKYDYEISEEEVIYLTLHLENLIK